MKYALLMTQSSFKNGIQTNRYFNNADTYLLL